MNSDGIPDGRLAISGLSAALSTLQPIHSGSRHKLYRYRQLDAALVIKRNAAELASESAAAFVRHEFGLLRDVTLSGVVRVLGLIDTGSGLALAMEDAGDSNLAQRIQSGPLSTTAFLNMALQLAEAVAQLHGARIIHRDIHPGNVVWNSEREVATLCDFAIARVLPALVMESPNPNQLEGTLPYMSPEQTGRTGRSVDWRADLYSLGATFYEMLTGVPPFAGGDAAALAHAQIARRARPPHELNAQVPLTLSRIVLKLLEKDPGQRYQSATALALDLREAKNDGCDLGEEMFDGFARGEVVYAADIESVHGLTEGQRAAYRAVGVKAFVNVPLLRDGTYSAGIGGHDTRPRPWTLNEFELIREVAARTWTASERARAEVALREADKQKDDFLAMLAHELRNPLASIHNASELLARTATGGPLTDRPLAVLRRQTKQLIRLVDDLLDLSRIARGRIILEETSVEIGEVIDQAVETVQALIRERSHCLLVTKTARSIYVHGDRTRLVQATEVRILVEDNGTGIAPGLLPHLFDRFVQSERTLDRSQGGLGIGLSVVKRLIEMHRGSVQAAKSGRRSRIDVHHPSASDCTTKCPASRRHERAHVAPAHLGR